MCVYTRVCVCVCACLCVCVCVCVCGCGHLYARALVCPKYKTHAPRDAYEDSHTHMDTHCAHTHRHMHIHTHTYTYTHTHTQAAQGIRDELLSLFHGAH
jgi:hypothetical protein